MKAHHTQTHAPLRGRASSLLRFEVRDGVSAPDHKQVRVEVRQLFGLRCFALCLSLFLFLCVREGPLLNLWDGGSGCPAGDLFCLKGNVLGVKTCHPVMYETASCVPELLKTSSPGRKDEPAHPPSPRLTQASLCGCLELGGRPRLWPPASARGTASGGRQQLVSSAPVDSGVLAFSLKSSQ